MIKQLIAALFSIAVLAGCTNNIICVRHDVAISGDSERIAYNLYGTGETALIFIHGWSCDSRYWQKQLSVFSKDYQVITIDLAGHGNSSLDRIDYTMLSFAKDVKAVIEKEKVNKAILVGHSMGGGVIAEASRLMPDIVIGIIGVDTLQNVAEIIPQETLDEMITSFESDFKNAAQGFAMTLFLEKTDTELINWVKEDMSSAPGKVALSAFGNYIGQYVNGQAAQVFLDIHIPVASINARLWPTSPEDNRKHIDNYKLIYIEETGHFPMIEKPGKFNTLLKEAIKYIEAEKSNIDT